ncbi:26S protease regulatory subunit [Sporomusa aerivorans]|uniref:ATP-binding protein n=1 Tax=Sporomusa aerivorans TaxID=204936 RepID=UPI00352A0797
MDKIELIQKMIEQDCTNAYAWYLLGLEYCEQGVESLALQAFSEALKYGDEALKNKIFVELGKLASKNQAEASPASRREANEGFEKIHSEKAEKDEDLQEAAAVPDNLISLKVIEGGKRIGNSLDQETPAVRFHDVGGLDNLKEIIRMKIVKPFINPGLFDRFRKKTGGGILLFGPPGCGKTYIAKATAGECNAKFIPVHITDILDPYLGMSSQNIKDIFANARAKKPCILFFDEIDTVGYNRSKLSSEHMRPIVDHLLAEIEGIDSSTDKLLIIGATNMPWDVDSAFKRPGRFDKTVFVPPPDEAARISIFKLKLAGRPVETIDYELLAKATELYSGADIDNVVEVATENVIHEILSSGKERPISMKDLSDAITSTKPSTIEWLRTIKNYVKYANQAGLYDDVERYLSKHKKILG